MSSLPVKDSGLLVNPMNANIKHAIGMSFDIAFLDTNGITSPKHKIIGHNTYLSKRTGFERSLCASFSIRNWNLPAFPLCAIIKCIYLF